MSNNRLSQLREGMGFSGFVGKKEEKIVVHLPILLHNVVSDLIFLEEISLKSFVRRALDKKVELSCLDMSQIEQNINKLSKNCKHSSVYITKDEHKSIRAIKHYKKIDMGLLIQVSMILLIKDNYRDKHPDIEGINEVVNVIAFKHKSNEA